MKIKKVAQTPGVLATVSTSKIDSDKDTYSCNYLNDNAVVVSPTEPSDGKVWIQTGKNLFDKNNYNLWHGYIDENLNFVYNDLANLVSIPIKPNKTYTISKSTTVESFDVGTGDVLPISGEKANSYQTYTGQSSATITTGENDKFIYVYFYWGSNTNAALEILETLQIEQGEVATTYEPYITKKIHTNTGNGYEEFYNDENTEIYSKKEQRIGTWIDGKPLYRKTYSGTTDVLLKHGVYVFRGFPYIDKLVSHKGFITFVDSEKTFVHEIGCYESDVHFSGIQLYKDGGDLRIFGGDGYAIGSTYDLTIEYTKTTD